ncbi:MAG: hypothetical protein J6Y58_04905 [Clostridiales bacterium]|nr:hypothetical protein [Clostridiales bacterium]
MKPVFELITAAILSTGTMPQVPQNCYTPSFFFDTTDYYDSTAPNPDYYPCNLYEQSSACRTHH